MTSHPSPCARLCVQDGCKEKAWSWWWHCGCSLAAVHSQLCIPREVRGECLSEEPFWSPEHHAGRPVYFPGKPDGIWLACAEPKLGKSCWPLADLYVAMGVYQHLPLQGYQLKDQASWVNLVMLNSPWVQRCSRKHWFCDVPACPPGPVLQHHTWGLVCPQAVCM